MEIRDIEEVGYGLVLLQEICQGYDNGIYRARATRMLAHGGDRYISGYLLPRWAYGKLSTTAFIQKIEQYLNDAK